MLEADIDILRQSLVMVLNAFLSRVGWIVLGVLFIDFSRHLIRAARQHEPASRVDAWKLVKSGLSPMRIAFAYAIGGLALIFSTYAIIHALAEWLHPFCGKAAPFQTELFQGMQAWARISGALAVTALLFGGFSLALSLGRSPWLLGLGKILIILSCVTIFSGIVFTCNLATA